MPKRLTPRGDAAPPVEPIITGATMPPRPVKRQASKAKRTKVAPKSDIKYVYNLHHIPCRVTLASKREIQLEPRGQRGDVDVVNADEQQDPKYLANLNLIFELISPEQARTIIANQQTNAKTEDHPIWKHLRNEQGDPYSQRHATIEEVFEKQGIVVGTVEETGAGRFTDKNFTVSRASSPEIVQVPGSPGHPATELMQSVPAEISPDEYHEFLLWKQFREQQEALALRNSLEVTVAPVEEAPDA